MKRGLYIVLDGLDGSGKGTVFDALKLHYPDFRSLSNQGSTNQLAKVIFTREPGGTPLAEKIRELILHDPMDGLTEFFLFLAQRRDIRKTLIEPALLRGETVISDRSDSSTFAFQIYGRHQHDLLPLFRETRNLLSPLPDLYIILDVPTEVAQARLAARQRRAGDFDRIDSESIEFHERVRQGFLQLKSEVACPCIFIDATRPPSEVAIDVVSEVAHFLRERLS